VHATDALREADRLMTICNACRYCEGVCPVFPAMELRRTFADGDLNYLANLCHGCGACFDDCQFAPPHAFDVNVPRTLAIVRADSYAAYAWPRFLAGTFRRNGLALTLAAAASVALFVAGFVGWHDPQALFAAGTEPGAFYRLMPHGAMIAIFGAAFVYAVVALVMGLRAFMRDAGAGRSAPTIGAAALWQALGDAGRLRYLDGGGAGCADTGDDRRDRRRLFHHLTFYGFALCFASTATATLYHYLLGRVAPYPWYDLPVVLGALGGIGLVAGPAGLLAEKLRRDPALADGDRFGMETAFIAMLFLTALTGLLLLIFRATPMMGLLLAVHLGVVFGFFITMPTSKFVHGLYRFAALVRNAAEQEAAAPADAGAGTPERAAPIG